MRIILITLAIYIFLPNVYAETAHAEEKFVNERHPAELSEAERKAYLAKLKSDKILEYAKENAVDISSLDEKPQAIDKEPLKRPTDLGTCQELGAKILSCSPYKCKMPHPEAKKFQIEHEVLGFVGDALLCHHTQTIPGNGIIDCKYPKAMRVVIAKQFAGKGDLKPEEIKVLSDEFPRYCRVIK